MLGWSHGQPRPRLQEGVEGCGGDVVDVRCLGFEGGGGGGLRLVSRSLILDLMLDNIALVRDSRVDILTWLL